MQINTRGLAVLTVSIGIQDCQMGIIRYTEFAQVSARKVYM